MQYFPALLCRRIGAREAEEGERENMGL